MKLTPNQMATYLKVLATHNTTLPPTAKLVPFIQSAPGMAKSSIVAQVAMELGRVLIDVRPAYMSPLDVAGAPFIEGREEGESTVPCTRMAKNRWMPPANCSKKYLLLLDEVSLGSKATANALLELVFDKRIGEHRLPEDVFIVLAGNRPEDRTGAERMPSALINRVQQVELCVDVPQWLEWAGENGIHEHVLGFIQVRPHLLHKFASKADAHSTTGGAAWDGASGFPTPRSWEAVSHSLRAGFPSEELVEAAIEGSIGEAAATDFIAFRRLVSSEVDPLEILRNPEGVSLPTTPDVQVASTLALAPHLTKENFGKAVAYLNRLPKETAAFAFSNYAKQKAMAWVVSTPEFKAWVLENKEVLV